MTTMRSSLTNKNMPTVKHSSRRGKKISRVIVHHWAGTAGGVERLVHSGDQASANYIILSDGTLIASVPEEYRAWTSGSAAADEPSITVEVQNSTLGPEWRVSDAAITTLTRLIADIAKRHGWEKITRSRVRGHREFKATACPGPYLYPLLPKIAADAEKLRKPTDPGWYTVSGLKGTDRLVGRSGPSLKHKVKHRRENGFEIYAVKLVKGDGITWAVTRYGTYYSTGFLTKGKSKPKYRTVYVTASALNGRSSPNTSSKKNIKFVRPKGFKLVVRDVPSHPQWVVTRYNTYYWKAHTK